MSRKFYIADLHFGHGNLNTKMDKRGFESVEEMNEYMIKQWNSVVHCGDEVYILGDLFWCVENKDDIIHILNRMKGKKYLIRGNHDDRWIKAFDNDKYHSFKWIKDYAEIKDNKRRVILSHYPMMSYNHQFHDNTYMLHGHIHLTEDIKLINEYKKACKNHVRWDDKMGYESPKANIINCFCMMSDYKPLTLDQWIELENNGALDVTLKDKEEDNNIYE